MATGLVHDARMEAHEDASGLHVERPDRTRSIIKKLLDEGLEARCKRIDPVPADRDTLHLVHQADYVAHVHTLKHLPPRKRMIESFNFISVYINEHTTDAALLSCGSLVKLTELVVQGSLKNAVAVIRPPGHHAEEDHAMGFCFFNNVAVAAAYAKHKLGLKRILIVDWDVHHGNGTQHMFWRDGNILFFSMHRFDQGYFDPGGPAGGPDQVGEGEGAGKNVNVGWNTTDVGDESCSAAFEQILKPMCEEYNPELVIISAGFDSAKGDPLGRINITPAGYSQMTRYLMGLAGGKVVVALEGGYNLEAISASMAAVVSTLLGDEPLVPEAKELAKSCQESIDATLKAHEPHWKFLGAAKRKREDP